MLHDSSSVTDVRLEGKIGVRWFNQWDNNQVVLFKERGSDLCRRSELGCHGLKKEMSEYLGKRGH